MSGFWHHPLDSFRQAVGPPLETVYRPIDTWLNDLPSWAPQACAVGLFVVVAIGVLCLKRDYAFLGAPDRLLRRDLRIWAILTMLPYVLVYLLFK